MPVMCVSAVLLWVVVVDISARVLTTTSPADQLLLSPRHYQHTDPVSGTQLFCDKCPAGTYVSVHCSLAAERDCSPCPEGTFTRGENGVQQCHRCRALCPAGFIEKVPCTATQDRVCTCPPSSFLSGDGGNECKPHSLCPRGTRVKKRGSETEDVLCKPCNKGTFSDEDSSVAKCRTHTDCQAQGLVLLTPGTRERDNVCGSPSTAPPSSSSSSPVSTASPLGPVWTVHAQEPVSSSPSSLLAAHKDTYSQSAAILLWENPDGKDHQAESLLLSRMTTHTPPNRQPIETPLPPARKQLVDRKGHPNSDPMPGPNKRAMEGLEDAEVVKVGTGINKIAGQGSGGGVGGVSSSYRPTRRGSPRPNTHNHFDINEHLPWMIVLLLLLVLVVIVVCSVKRSSRVLKKGPMQDPSSIMEKAIQKKPSVPPMQVKEKWIYYSNGQGESTVSFVSNRLVLESRTLF
ncbi:tumor necrosis factor receptor superfamily member 21 [Scomber japonicus]|uniref:tumor necrosis factor receptor superfamily member 21 n=1 Tax=Scomber japonicus TaxID=13676 RepID=UPI002306DB46|nr:tumor necrosis factor receptor superfamily member 21 [Scomber japonicus]